MYQDIFCRRKIRPHHDETATKFRFEKKSSFLKPLQYLLNPLTPSRLNFLKNVIGKYLIQKSKLTNFQSWSMFCCLLSSWCCSNRGVLFICLCGINEFLLKIPQIAFFWTSYFSSLLICSRLFVKFDAFWVISLSPLLESFLLRPEECFLP